MPAGKKANQLLAISEITRVKRNLEGHPVAVGLALFVTLVTTLAGVAGIFTLIYSNCESKTQRHWASSFCPYLERPALAPKPSPAPPLTPAPVQPQPLPPPPVPTPVLPKPLPVPHPKPAAPAPSRADLLLAALREWRSHGVAGDGARLELLRTETEAELDRLGDVDQITRDEISAARAVLNASRTGISEQTMGELPIYVRTSGEDENALSKNLSDALTQDQFVMASDEQHAALIIVLGAPDYAPLETFQAGIYTRWRAAVKLPVEIIYNNPKTRRAALPASVASGHAEGAIDIGGERLKSCALLDAGLSAVDTFAKSVDGLDRAQRPSCHNALLGPR